MFLMHLITVVSEKTCTSLLTGQDDFFLKMLFQEITEKYYFQVKKLYYVSNNSIKLSREKTGQQICRNSTQFHIKYGTGTKIILQNTTKVFVHVDNIIILNSDFE